MENRKRLAALEWTTTQLFRKLSKNLNLAASHPFLAVVGEVFL